MIQTVRGTDAHHFNALHKMIRIYQKEDYVAIANIFSRAVHEIASEVYTTEQCLVWSDREPNPDHWKKRCELKRPFVSLIGSEIAGFLELDPDGHIDCAYVNPDFRHQGVVSQLVKHAKQGVVKQALTASSYRLMPTSTLSPFVLRRCQ